MGDCFRTAEVYVRGFPAHVVEQPGLVLFLGEEESTHRLEKECGLVSQWRVNRPPRSVLVNVVAEGFWQSTSLDKGNGEAGPLRRPKADLLADCKGN